MYILDVETMRQVMLAHKKTGCLRSELPSGFLGQRESCSVEIVLQAGKMISCSIAGSRGILLTGNKAYQELARLERLTWNFVPEQPPATLSGPASRPLEKKVIPCPCRIALVTQQQILSWPRIHRLVYGLADGTRNVAEIAALTSTPPEIIERALQDLQSIGVISIQQR